MTTKIPFGPLGYFTYKRTYARKLPNSEETEEFEQTIDRVISACDTQLNCGFTADEQKEFKGLLMSLKGSVAGRFLWQLGTATVDRLGLMSLQNCALTVVDEPIKPFTWTFDAMMLGCVPPSTPILTKDGVKRFDQVQIGDLVQSFNQNTGKIELKPVVATHDVRVSKDQNIKISGNYGNFITSKKHPVLVLRGGEWVYEPAGNLRIGDTIQKAGFTSEDKIFNKKAWYAGAFLGDGCSNVNDSGSFRVRITKDNEAVVSNFTQIGHELFGTSINYKLSPSRTYSVPMWVAETTYTESLQNKFEKIIGRCVGGKKSSSIEIPRWIQESYDANAFASFLAGLIDTDGSICGTKVAISTTSKILADQLEELCPAFGFFPWKNEHPARGFSGAEAKPDAPSVYTLTFSAFDFWDYVGFFKNTAKRDALDFAVRSRKWCGKQQVTVPSHLAEEEADILDLGYRTYHFKAKLSRDGCAGKSYYHRGGYSVSHLLKFDTVTSIETELDISENFKDITVKDNHSYLVGDGAFYVLHNCGVGYNIQKENVYQLPKVKYVKYIERKDTNDADFIVPDSREGWVKLLEKVLESYFITGKSFTYSTVCVRGKGAAIKSFGGTASGPEELCWGMSEIGKVLQAREGKKVRPIDVLDVMNIIGFVVVSGNVRRSAAIAIGDADDMLFLNAKNWAQGNVPNWRAMSNNSVVCNDIKYLPDAFWNGYTGDGEPYGLINLKLSRKVGRLGEDRFDNIQGYNPCSEQGLEDKETCCLAELFVPNLSSFEESKRIAYFLYRVCKHSLALPCHSKDTEAIVHKNMRMGIGVTGYLQATEEQKTWLSPLYKYLRALDREYSKKHGWPESIKLTTAKPSGTLSLLPGVTPGVHPGFSRYYIRRIRVASNSPLADLCRTSGYDVEFQKNFDSSSDTNTVVVSFPCELPEGTVVAKDLTAIQQLEYVNRVQRDWSDNGVSVTVYYKLEELPGIKEWLKKNYNKSLKAVSFLLHSEHGFVQAPYEEIDLDTYLKMNAKITPIQSVNVNFSDVSDNLECATGACPVR